MKYLKINLYNLRINKEWLREYYNPQIIFLMCQKNLKKLINNNKKII